MAKLDIRAHGRWKLLDWLWLAPFVLLASVWGPWRRAYWGRFVTVSILTHTLYTPKGRTPKPSTLAHEQRHIDQAKRDGLIRWGLRYALSTRWRIVYEAEAFAVQGRGAVQTVETLRTMYLVRWPYEHVRGLVCAARASIEDAR